MIFTSNSKVIINDYLLGGADVKATGSAQVSTFWPSKLYAEITRTIVSIIQQQEYFFRL